MSAVCGLPLVDMPEGIIPLAAVVVVKALDAGGDLAYYTQVTDDVTAVEMLGMIRYADLRLSNAITADEARP